MKRSQEFSPPSPDTLRSAPHKKAKTARVSHGISVQDGAAEDVDMEGGGSWTKVEKRKAKKAKRREAPTDSNAPKFMYVKGEIQKRRDAVGINDIRDFILHLIADAPPCSWVRVENPRSVQKVVALLIPGITPDILGLPPLPTSATTNPNVPILIPESPMEGTSSKLPFIAKTFSHACPTKAPGEATRMHSVLSAFFQVSVTGEEKKKRQEERVASERAQGKSPLTYLLSIEQMIESEYPIPSHVAEVFEKPPDWVESPDMGEDGAPKIYALDCEMCLTEDGKELARVCVIDYESDKVIYDQLVKPRKPIIDYLTRWSGITAEAMGSVTTTFEEVQSHVLSLLSVSPTPVLVGHSLEFDLKSLKICHSRVIDTALIYHHPKGRPFKPGLAWLTKKWCGREIQNKGEGGHDPEEDARACVELLRKKVANGAGYGEFKSDYESIFERMSRAKSGTLRTAVVDHGNPAVMYGSKATTAIGCTTDSEILEGLLGAIPTHDFAFGRFTALADALGWISNKNSLDPLSDPAAGARPAAAVDVDGLLSTLDAQLKALYAVLPARTALVIFTGHSDPRKMVELNARKAAFESAFRVGKSSEEMGPETRWAAADARELEAEVERAKRGLLFLGVKDAVAK